MQAVDLVRGSTHGIQALEWKYFDYTKTACCCSSKFQQSDFESKRKHRLSEECQFYSEMLSCEIVNLYIQDYV